VSEMTAREHYRVAERLAETAHDRKETPEVRDELLRFAELHTWLSIADSLYAITRGLRR
jgi:hypothetical protein